MQLCPEIEKYIVEGGIQLIKIWLEVGKDEQERRFLARMSDPLRQWKLSPMDLDRHAPLVRLLPRPRHDARGDGHRARAMAHRALPTTSGARA